MVSNHGPQSTQPLAQFSINRRILSDRGILFADRHDRHHPHRKLAPRRRQILLALIIGAFCHRRQTLGGRFNCVHFRK
ncbi:MAG: hypothetical protein B7Y43_14810 [Sphingomonas sp. 28-62-20]|nr:MAG: hypothetical protein B7Y43_14810 [Sphingomonas sp. 28-62-20]